jgi:hypothetical protein
MFLTRKRRKQRLTPEQIELFKTYQKKWLNIAQSTKSVNQEQVEFAISVLYRKLDLPRPQIHFFQGPTSFAKAKIYRTKQEQWRSNILKNSLVIMMPLCIVWMTTGIGLLFNPLLYEVLPIIGLLASIFFVSYCLQWFVYVRWGGNSLLYTLMARSLGWTLIICISIGPLVTFILYPERFNEGWVLASVILTVLLFLGSYFTEKYRLSFLKNRFWEILYKNLTQLNLENILLIQQLYFLLSQDDIAAGFHGIHGRRGLTQRPQIFYRRPNSYSSTLERVYVRDGGLTSEASFFGSYNEHFLAIDQSNQHALTDFCIQELDCNYDHELWEASQTLIQECGFLLLLSKSCYVCDRPFRLEMDAEQRLHSVAGPAIEFADSTCVYAYQGIILPEKYGMVHPQEWQSQWVLEESNAEIRRLLIQEIGYERLCQELSAKVLDQWREYELLKIEVPQKAYVNRQQVIEEPVVLLKMTCPSTAHIHVLRVPPTMRSAKKAAQWINHDISPDKFIAET